MQFLRRTGESSNSEAAVVLANTRAAAGDERAIVFVHHVGHNEKHRERGAYQLRANADFRFQVERDRDSEVITLTNVKAKDGPEIAPMRFEWRSVHLGNDDDGDDISSLIVEPTDREPASGKSRDTVRIGNAETAAWELLLAAVGQRAAREGG